MSKRREAIADELLVLACQEGRSEAFRQLHARWQAPLWRHARRLTGREDAAWDVIQEAWLAIAGGLHRLRDPGGFRAWAYTIVTRRAADWCAMRRREPEAVDGHDIPAPAPDDDGSVTAVAALQRALRQLSGERRALLSLRYVDEFQLREIAAILGMPEGTVKSRLYHAREELRAVMKRMNQ